MAITRKKFIRTRRSRVPYLVRRMVAPPHHSKFHFRGATHSKTAFFSNYFFDNCQKSSARVFVGNDSAANYSTTSRGPSAEGTTVHSADGPIKRDPVDSNLPQLCQNGVCATLHEIIELKKGNIQEGKIRFDEVNEAIEETGHKNIFHRDLRQNWSKLVTDKISVLAFTTSLKGHHCPPGALNCSG